MTSPAAAAREPWDAIVVGSGAGGGVAAWRLAVAGGRVLVVERGAPVPRRALAPDEIASVRRDRFVPQVATDPHVLAEEGAPPRRSFEGWTACCVGGGTVHMSAMLFRMRPEDFDGARRYGVPAGSTLSDWPIPAAALAPYYQRVEELVGVSTSLPRHPAAEAVERAARAAGATPRRTPRGHLAAARDGRGACVRCGYCGGYACPTGGKASVAETFLPLAMATGRCLVLPRARAVEVAPGAAVVLDEAGARHRIAARHVVLAASAVETARLLLLSRLGGPAVGRNLLFALESAGRAVFPAPSELFPAAADGLPFLDVHCADRCVDPDAPGGYPKGGTLVLERVHPNPIARGLAVARRGALGAELVRGLRRAFVEEREIVWESFIEMLPRAGARVELDPEVVDAAGLPAARIALDSFAHEAARASRVGALARAILAGLAPSLVEEAPLRRTTYLQAGTCRMGTDPETSVIGPDGGLHGVPGVFVVDGAALPTMGGVPPTLTIMANAWRIADSITG